MIPIRIDQSTPARDTYRAERVRSLFNATDDQATRFTLTADLPIDLDGDWQVGLVVGPSGSGKTSIGRAIFGEDLIYAPEWPAEESIVEAIHADGDFNTVTGALAQAGLGDVPAWLRPYGVLSMGQRFRADLARVLAERPDRVVLDEFTSVVDRQIARVGAAAFQKAWRRGTGKAVLLSCHYDVIDWVQPDWIFDTATGKFETKESVQARPRPRIDVDIRLGGWDLWPLFKPHHYLASGPMIGAKCYVGFVDGEPVVHMGMGTKNVQAKNKRGKSVHAVEARGCRLVTMPEWQGAGIASKFMDEVCDLQLRGEGILPGRRMTTVFHTSHPQLCEALRRNRRWRQISGVLHGSNKGSSRASLRKAKSGEVGMGSGYGGHFRAVQGFRYYGKEAAQ